MLAGIGLASGCVGMILQTKFSARMLESGSSGTDRVFAARDNRMRIQRPVSKRAVSKAGRREPRSEDDAFLS
jgi:hypothetical protein